MIFKKLHKNGQQEIASKNGLQEMVFKKLHKKWSSRNCIKWSSRNCIKNDLQEIASKNCLQEIA